MEAESRQLRSLVGYLISHLAEAEINFGKTKLVKLLYLIDVETYRRRGHLLTGANWLFYHYGPYAIEIDQALKSLDLDIPEEAVVTTKGHRALVYRPSRHIHFPPPDSAADRTIINGVLDRWATEDLNPLLSYVYFQTEPMKEAVRGYPLDFSTIKRVSVLAPPEPKYPEPPRDERLRSAFLAKLKERKATGGMPLTPAPRLDDLYWDAVGRLERDEQLSLPSGEVSLTEEAKTSLRVPKENS